MRVKTEALAFKLARENSSVPNGEKSSTSPRCAGKGVQEASFSMAMSVITARLCACSQRYPQNRSHGSTHRTDAREVDTIHCSYHIKHRTPVLITFGIISRVCIALQSSCSSRWRSRSLPHPIDRSALRSLIATQTARKFEQRVVGGRNVFGSDRKAGRISSMSGNVK